MDKEVGGQRPRGREEGSKGAIDWKEDLRCPAAGQGRGLQEGDPKRHRTLHGRSPGRTGGPLSDGRALEEVDRGFRRPVGCSRRAKRARPGRVEGEQFAVGNDPRGRGATGAAVLVMVVRVPTLVLVFLTVVAVAMRAAIATVLLVLVVVIL